MARKITRDKAIRKAINEALGTDNSSGMYSMRNIKNMVEMDFLPALEAVGYTITDIDTAFRGMEAVLASADPLEYTARDMGRAFDSGKREGAAGV